MNYSVEVQVHVVGSYCTCNKWALNLVAEGCTLIQSTWTRVAMKSALLRNVHVITLDSDVAWSVPNHKT